MAFPILGANSATGGFEVSNSLRFNNDDSALLSLSQTAGNRRVLTFSTWLKRSSLGDQNIFNGGDSSAEFTALYFTSADELFLYDYRGAEGMSVKTNRKFRDVSAWYHIVVAFDTTQSTASNRVKIYVNGVQETSFSSSNYPAQNLDLMLNVNSSFTTRIGRYPTSATLYFDGYMCETAVVEDAQLEPTSFGEFDDNNVWIPKDLSSLTFGDEGFYLKYKQTGTSQNSSGIGADSSGNDNHFAVTNLAAQDITEDTCTNNFATLNGIDHRVEDATLSEGNCKFVGANGNDGASTSTIGVTSGKWYAEFKFLNNHKSRVGIIDQTGHHTNGNNVNDGVHYDFTGGYIYTSLNGTGNDTGNNSTSGGYDVTDGSTNDILGVALDADNEKVLFTLNGTTLGQEGDGFTPLQRTGTGETFFFHVRDGSGSGDDEPQIVCNFGNPPPDFSISSSNTDGKYGNFEYAPPSGFYALCTKRLAEFG